MQVCLIFHFDWSKHHLSHSIWWKEWAYGFKDVVLEKVTIPKAYEDFDMDSKEEKKFMFAAGMIELTYTKLGLLMMRQVMRKRLLTWYKNTRIRIT